MMADDDVPPERVDLWLNDALRLAMQGLSLLHEMTQVPPTVPALDAAASRLTKSADACQRAIHMLNDAERRKGLGA